jgi:hypothetical protein
MGTTVKLEEILKEVRNLLAAQELQAKAIEREKDRQQEKIFNYIIEAPPVSLKPGQSVKVNLHVYLPIAVENDPGLKFDVDPKSELKVKPAEVALKDAPNEQDVPIEIAAGNAVGKFKITITPAQGKNREIIVLVAP